MELYEECDDMEPEVPLLREMSYEEVPLDSIVIEANRIRIELGDIDGLAASISLHGLLHPIVIDRQNTLIAGFRRYLAHQKLGAPTIRVTRFGDLDETTRKRIELEENTRRLQLSWQEEILATKQIHELMQTIHGPSTQGQRTDLASTKPGWNLAQTAKLLGKSVGLTHADIQLASAVSVLPTLSGARNKAAAILAMRKIKEGALLKELATRGLQLQTKSLWTLIQGDACEELQRLTEPVDLILMDPPYGIDYGETRTNRDGISPGITYKDSFDSFITLMSRVSKEMFRLLKPGCFCFVFSDYENFIPLLNIMQMAGFDWRPRPLIWVKTVPTPGQVQGGGFMNRYELIGVFWKDVCRPLRLNANDVLEYPAPQQRIHSSEKPVDLLKYLIEISTEPGELVLDPMMGSGSTLVAATKGKRRSIGIEILDEAYGLAIARLEGGLL